MNGNHQQEWLHSTRHTRICDPQAHTKNLPYTYAEPAINELE